MIASLVLTETGGLFDVEIGDSIDVAQSTTFDHAALVTAKLSRADGYDLSLKGDSGERITITSISGANTSTCRLIFNLGQDSLVSSGTLTFSLNYGNLGLNSSPFSGTPGTTVTARGAAVSGVYTFSTVTLPDAAFPLGETIIHDIDAVGSGASPTVRTAVRNKNSRKRSTLTWRAITPEDAYQIRAWIFARLGGASTFPHTHTSFLSSGTYRLIPSSVRIEQMTRRAWNVSLDVEEVYV